MKEKCAICGKKAKYISKKFISPLCKSCAEEEAKRLGREMGIKFPELEDFYTQPCEEMEDIDKEYTNTEIKG